VRGLPATIGGFAPNHPRGEGASYDRVQARVFFCLIARLTLAVAPLDGKAIVAPRSLHVSVGEIGCAVGANLASRREVIHLRAAPVGTGHEVVVEAKHMTHFVAGK